MHRTIIMRHAHKTREQSFARRHEGLCCADGNINTDVPSTRQNSIFKELHPTHILSIAFFILAFLTPVALSSQTISIFNSTINQNINLSKCSRSPPSPPHSLLYQRCSQPQPPDCHRFHHPPLRCRGQFVHQFDHQEVRSIPHHQPRLLLPVHPLR